MKTTKPISTISFNTENFLHDKLTELTRAGIVSFWAYVTHQPEPDEGDEGGKKMHYHVYIEPSKSIQTDDIREQFRELDPCKPDKPLGCLKFVRSKFDDWYMYGLHDAKYLASKGQSRTLHYTSSDFISSDDGDFLYMVRSIDMLSLSPYDAMVDAISQGLTFDQFFARGTVSPMQIRNMQLAWSLLIQNKTNRNNRVRHVNNFDDIDTVTDDAGTQLYDSNAVYLRPCDKSDADYKITPDGVFCLDTGVQLSCPIYCHVGVLIRGGDTIDWSNKPPQLRRIYVRKINPVTTDYKHFRLYNADYATQSYRVINNNSDNRLTDYTADDTDLPFGF